MDTNSKAGLGALLTPENCVLILIDHQPFQFAGLRSHDSQTVINNVVGLAKTAKVFDVPTLLTTVMEQAGEGYDVYAVTDASGGVSVEAHEMAIHRMIQAGVTPITWNVFGAELQRDWARTQTIAELGQALVEHAGNIGLNAIWEQQLLATEPEEVHA